MPDLDVQKAGNDEGVHPRDVEALFQDFLSMLKYRDLDRSRTAARSTAPTTVQCNEDFWLFGSRFHEGQRVVLSSFALLEWMPASPGRYFTREATQKRQ
jgi:hypothetical protein